MAKTPEQPIRELIPTGILTPFGEVMDDPANPIEDMLEPDVTWTKGWSDIRLERDKQLAEVAQGKRSPRDVRTLPGNLRLVRRSTVNGKPDGAKQIKAGNSGYRPVTKQDVGSEWFKEIPQAATVFPDGSIGLGDCVYMWADGQAAARNVVRKERLTQERLGAAQARAESAGLTYDSQRMAPLSEVPASRVKAT